MPDINWNSQSAITSRNSDVKEAMNRVLQKQSVHILDLVLTNEDPRFDVEVEKIGVLVITKSLV